MDKNNNKKTNNQENVSNTYKPKINGLTGKVLESLRKEYMVIGKTRVWGWHAWLVIGILAGAVGGAVLIANRSGEFVATSAAVATLSISPSFATTGVNGRAHLTALLDPDGPGPLPIENVSRDTRWTSYNLGLVTVSVPPLSQGAVLLGKSPGIVTVYATYDGQIASAKVQIAGQVLSRSLLTPDGRTRTYTLYVPAFYSAAKPVPLVLNLHGGGGQGKDQEILSNLDTIAAEKGFLVAYPDGVDKHWNDGRGIPDYTSHKENIDDVGFISSLIDTISSQYSIERNRIYVTGMSNGSLMAKRLACNLSNKIAAIGTVGSTIPRAITSSCTFSRPVPIVHFHGTKDSHALWNGGDMAGGDTLSVPELMQFWSAKNGCYSTEPPAVTYERDVANDGTRIRRETRVCPTGAETILYAVEEGGHTWPQGYQYFPETNLFPSLAVGKTSRDMSASAVIWGFFLAHPMRL